MTEEDRLRSAPGCGGFIMMGLIIIVLLSLLGIIFPTDILPYPREILAGVLIIAAIALVVALCMWRGKVKERREAENKRADDLLRKGFDTLGDKHDEAARLAKLYQDDDTPHTEA